MYTQVPCGCAGGLRLDGVRSVRPPAPHKDFSDLYEKMSGKGESASEAHMAMTVPVPHKDFSDLYRRMNGKGASASEAHRVGK